MRVYVRARAGERASSALTLNDSGAKRTDALRRASSFFIHVGVHVPPVDPRLV